VASLLFFSFFLLVWFLVLILYLTLSPPLISSVSLSCNSSLLFFPSIVGINSTGREPHIHLTESIGIAQGDASR